MDKQKKPWYKRWWAITLFIFIGLGILGNLLDSESDNPQSQSQVVKTQTEQKTEVKESVESKEAPSSKNSNVQDLQQTSAPQKSLIEMLPKREDIPTEFKTGSPYNLTFREYPKGFDSGVSIEPTKIVGSSGYIELDFDIIKFDSEENARKYHVDFTNRVKNEGGYTEIDIEVPSKAECFSFTEDYGYQSRFATSNCLKGNLEYHVLVTAAYAFEKPQKYIKDMMILLDNRINK